MNEWKNAEPSLEPRKALVSAHYWSNPTRACRFCRFYFLPRNLHASFAGFILFFSQATCTPLLQVLFFSQATCTPLLQVLFYFSPLAEGTQREPAIKYLPSSNPFQTALPGCALPPAAASCAASQFARVFIHDQEGWVVLGHQLLQRRKREKRRRGERKREEEKEGNGAGCKRKAVASSVTLSVSFPPSNPGRRKWMRSRIFAFASFARQLEQEKQPPPTHGWHSPDCGQGAGSMASDFPPTISIQLVEEPRLLKLKKTFMTKFKSTPKFYARAPGRVNLIGEHIDYCGYAVLPMAIEQDILIAAEPLSTPDIHLANTNPLYSDFHTNADNIQINQAKPLWHNYFLCGFKGIEEHFDLQSPRGVNCLVEGTIPPSSGLSSSSALVCCAGLATLVANGKTLPKVELAELCSRSERYIGTEGGGMDQSICFLAEKGTAKLIKFNPLRATDVRLPKGAAFVIANSCVEMNKAATSHFNIRVMECRLATKLLAKSRGLDWKEAEKLQEVPLRLKLSLAEMLEVLEEVLHPEPYSLEEIGQKLGMSPKQLRTEVLSQNTQDVATFKLYQRAKHVYSEAARVLEFKKICTEAPEDALRRLGDLMNQSHASCRDLYECSCPELDQLVDTCLQFGAVGSRLTGAGWGGCAVSMVPVDKLEGFLAGVKEAYYKHRGQRLAQEESSLFATHPGGGAAVFLEA